MALSLKVSPKGAVQLNGLRRFPVTLYRDEWEQVFEKRDAIIDFIDRHDNELKGKPESNGVSGESI